MARGLGHSSETQGHKPRTTAPLMHYRDHDLHVLADKHREFAALKECAQDPEWHAEGNVFIHTEMVVQALFANSEWDNLTENERQTLYLAALLHDIAKPVRTEIIDGRVRSPGHSTTGARMAREILWKQGQDVPVREQVAHLVRNHMQPYHVLDRADPNRSLIAHSYNANCKLLTILCQADSIGRKPRAEESLIGLELYREMAEDLGCWEKPYAFPDAWTRWQYFMRPTRNEHYQAYDDRKGNVTILSGLPGSGKDTWAASQDMPMISLDELRRKGMNTGQAVQQATEDFKGYLRRGEACIWNATNLQTPTRQKLINLAHDYNMGVDIVAIECAPKKLVSQNNNRKYIVPEAAIERMVHAWDAPNITESTTLTWHINN